MKPSEFKKIIKDAVKEAFQEELKEILLEAVKSPKSIVTESRDTYAQPHIEKPKKLTPSERQSMFGGILNEMQNGGVANTNSIPFRPTGPVDPVNGSLPEGEVGLDMIMGLMNNK
jgi:vacuolar-type H+-ATPase subunit E/Vma4